MQSKKNFRSGIFALTIFLCGLLPASSLWAHGGVSVEFDDCRIPVAGHWVHFTGYTPTFTADKEYCSAIPDVGLTHLVFDYEGKKLRGMTVEFEITKEPEGTRVYYQEPAAHKSGTVDAEIDFNQYGAGKYLVHVTLVNEDQKIDAHLPFTVGAGTGEIPTATIFGFVLALLGVGYIIYLSNEGFKRKVDVVLSKI